MDNAQYAESGNKGRALLLSTVSFGVCFAVWTIFSIIGVELQRELSLSETAFGLLVATPILTGSLSRILLGIWAQQFGGRTVFTALMCVVAACAFALPYAQTFAQILAVGLGLGLAGGSFSIGVVYVSNWFPREQQGTALGLFGMGTLGAAATSFGAPFLMFAIGWRETVTAYGALMLAMAAVFFLSSREDPVTAARRETGTRPILLRECLAPLRYLQVWRFSLYYFFVFGGFVALTSWLPRYFIGAYELDIRVAGVLTAGFALPAALFRALGGVLADRYGARTIMYVAFWVSLVCLFLLSYPNARYVVEGIHGPIEFTITLSGVQRMAILAVLGFGMALGMAAVFKHIPLYYSDHVGAVGGLVGMIGGLGGFFLPIAFGFTTNIVGIWTSCFMLLFGIAGISLIWMHLAIRRMEHRRIPELASEAFRYLPEAPASSSAKPSAARDSQEVVSSKPTPPPGGARRGQV
ncbi:MAG: NarK/NasA family nitrate transporter [Nitrococcus sp.]|nr:NarK/NasA family nitrate transporter [Nitrococcus sp.]